MADQQHEDSARPAMDEKAQQQAIQDAIVRNLVDLGHDEKLMREVLLIGMSPTTPAAQAKPSATSYTPPKIRPDDIGNLLPNLATVMALDASSAARMGSTASQASESILRGLSGLGGILWAATVYSRDAGEPVDSHDLAATAVLIAHLARAVSDLQDLESECRNYNGSGPAWPAEGDSMANKEIRTARTAAYHRRRGVGR